MQRQTPLDTSLRAYSSGGSRGCVLEADDKQEMQELKLNMMKCEQRKRVEHPQNYGFSSFVCKYEEKDQKPGDGHKDGGRDGPQGGQGGGGGEEGEEEIERCAEHFSQFMAGNRTFPVVQNLDDRRYRLRNIKEGEVVMYDDQQQKVHICRRRIFARSQFSIELGIIKDEPKKDGHGRAAFKDGDEPVKREQDDENGKEYPAKRLSTVFMDKDRVHIVRTNEDGDKLSETKWEEKLWVSTTYKDGKPHLQMSLDEHSNNINLVTYEEGDKPRLTFELDNETGKVEMGAQGKEVGESNLVIDIDDLNKRIRIYTEKNGQPQLMVELDGPEDKMTLKTDGKTEQIFDNSDGTITIHADTVVKVGDHSADKPCAMLGSVTNAGRRIVSKVSKKVLVPLSGGGGGGGGGDGGDTIPGLPPGKTLPPGTFDNPR